MTIKSEIMTDKHFLNQDSVNVDIHAKMRNALSISKNMIAIIIHLLIHATLIVSVMIVTVRNQILASDVDIRIISLQVF